MSGLGVSACGGQAGHTATSPPASTAASSTSAASAPTTVTHEATTPTAPVTTTSDVTTAAVNTAATTVGTVVGTTPLGQTVTETSTDVTRPLAGPDGVALETGVPLGALSSAITGQTIDGIQCNRLNQLAYQAYVHLQVYVTGHSRALPGGIGLVNAQPSTTGTTTTYAQTLCTYWLSTSAANGVIAVNSPVLQRFTLGELFDVWGQELSASDVAGVHGPVVARVGGRLWRGNPRTIPLREHESIELAVGRPVPRFSAVDWSVTDL